MGKFEGILLVSDIDATLFNREHHVSEENAQAIEYFKSEGGYFTFITGRMPFFVTDIYNTINPNAPFGCINGGGLYDHAKQEYVFTRELERSALELVEYADKNIADLGIQVNTFEKIYFSRENEAMANIRRVTGLPNITAHYHDVKEPIGKIVFGDTDEEKIFALRDLLFSHPRSDEFDYIRSEHTLYEILPKGVNKGSVLPRLCEYLGTNPKRTVAVGDYNNDVAMLKSAGIGVAVANACREAKEAADHITVSNEEHAIAKIIHDIENGILKI